MTDLELSINDCVGISQYLGRNRLPDNLFNLPQLDTELAFAFPIPESLKGVREFGGWRKTRQSPLSHHLLERICKFWLLR